MVKRPKLKLELSKLDKIVEIVGWLVMLAVWGLTLSNYQRLPEIIPTHYNGAGIADGFGDKRMILTLPLVATFLFIGLTILNRFPHKFNYPTEITRENASEQYTNATRLLRYLKGIVVFVFGLVTYQTILHANGETEGLGVWFLPLILGLIFIPVFIFLIRSLQ